MILCERGRVDVNGGAIQLVVIRHNNYNIVTPLFLLLLLRIEVRCCVSLHGVHTSVASPLPPVKNIFSSIAKGVPPNCSLHKTLIDYYYFY